MSEGDTCCMLTYSPFEEEAPEMGAGAALGSPVPPGEGAGRPRGLSLLASCESTRRRSIPAWPRCQQSPVPCRTVAAGRSALARRATSRLRRPECCTA